MKQELYRKQQEQQQLMKQQLQKQQQHQRTANFSSVQSMVGSTTTTPKQPTLPSMQSNDLNYTFTPKSTVFNRDSNQDQHTPTSPYHSQQQQQRYKQTSNNQFSPHNTHVTGNQYNM